MKTTTLDSTISKGTQDVKFVAVLEAISARGITKPAAHKLRATIKRDSYAFQSYATIERWDGGEWKELASVHYSKMQTPTALYYRQVAPNSKDFAADLAELLRLAALVLE